MTNKYDKILDPKDFEMEEIFQTENSTFYKSINSKAKLKYIFESFSARIDELSREKRQDLCRYIQIALKVNHPSILKFIGYVFQKTIFGIFYEYPSENTLSKLIKFFDEKKVNFKNNWNDTKVLINLYGIASGMSYLHEHNIIHCNLTPENIFLDKNNYPKIYNLRISKEVTANSKKNIEIRGTNHYLAPEVLESLEYSEKSDVYSYSIIAYDMLSKKIFSDDIEGNQGKRPIIDENIPKCYKELIERCWSENPNDRPTFSEILTELRENKEFITESINSSEYERYIKQIDKYRKTFKPQNLHQIDEYLNLFIDPKEFKLKDFRQTEKLTSSDLCNSYDVQKKGSKLDFLARVYLFEIRFFMRDQIVNLCREVNNMLQLNHPSILKLVGFSFDDFDNLPRPVVIFQSHIKTLAKIIRDEKENLSWNETKILINIYGIAAGMEYLHQHNIVHRDLKAENIYLDESYYPKIGGFHLSKEMKREEDETSQHLKGTPAYISPETYSKHIYNEKSDVYSYSLIIYELFSKHRAYEEYDNVEYLSRDINEEHKRPTIDENIPKCYKELIERCWSENPKDRPTFSSILKELRTNNEFINDSIDSSEYEQYIKYIDEFPITFEQDRRNSQLDDIMKTNLSTFSDYDINFKMESIYSTNTRNIPLKNEYFDMKEFVYISEKEENEEKNENFDDIAIKKSKICFLLRKIRNISTGKICVSKEYVKDGTLLYKYHIINFIRSLKIMLQLNHPSVLKCIGFYPTEFKSLPTVITEYASNGTLDKMINRKSNPEWNETKILINIYGIAAGMEYLHQHNIVHRDLKAENIYLDESYYPKIGGFHLSKEMKREEDETSQHLKGTPAYISPETYSKHIYNEKSDVYSYSLIIYELFSKHRAYEEYDNVEYLSRDINEEHKRPTIDENIPKCYKELIERCWSENPKDRPTFSSILKELRTNNEFISDSIDSSEYEQYIKHIEEYPITFEPADLHQIDEYYMTNIHLFPIFSDVSHLKDIYETEMNNILPNLHILDIKNYSKEKKIFQNKLIKIHEIKEEGTGNLFYCKEPYFDEVCENDDKRAIQSVMNYFYFEISYSFLLSHLSLLNFVGYSPTNYKGKQIPMAIYQHASHGSLRDIILIEKENDFIEGWDDTAKLIAIYGIASFLSYLHSKGNIHFNLTPDNIYLDDFFFPKITGIMIYQNQSDFFYHSNKLGTIKNIMDMSFFSPEIMEGNVFDKSVDIYSFAMIVYSIISKDIPFKRKTPFSIQYNILNGVRPEFKYDFPICYQKLVEKCWSQNPKDRLTADEVVFELETNPEFITENIDKEKYYNFIKLIEESLTSKESNIEELLKMKDYSFLKVRIGKEIQKKKFSLNIGSINLENFEKKTKIGAGSFGNVYKVLEKETGTIDAAKVSKYDINECDESTIINFEREIQIISELNFPSILKFVGYSPINFKNKLKPVVITELVTNGTLGSIIDLERKSCANHNWDDTKKLINIYGIAAGMKYLHQLNIAHRDLKPENILMDEFIFPKIADFGLSKHITNNNDEDNSIAGSDLKGTYAYCAPEILKYNNYTLFGDVYAFGIIVYEIMTDEELYKGLDLYQLFKLINECYRPEFKYPIADCYRDLIERCWSEDYKSRPSFEEIVELLETDKNFITENVDEEEYLDYVSYIKESFSSNETKKSKHKQFNKVEMKNNDQIKKEEEEKLKENPFHDFFLDLSKFEREKIISKSDYSKLYKVKDKRTNIVYQGEISIFEVNNVSNEEMSCFVNELKIITQMDHPTFLKLIGYSPIDFKNNPNPTIISELCLNNTLKDIFDLEKKIKTVRGWDDTKKLINLYGIASGMSYLHSHEILHRNLRMENVFLDDYLFPKIGNFGLLTRFLNLDMMSHQSMTGLKCTPIYSSPEVLQTKSYSKASDVYSFAFIVYQVVTGEVPFSNLSSSHQVFNEVVLKGERPRIKETVPNVYQELIKKCWSEDPNERPTFEEISTLLKTNAEFITDEINKDDFIKYIKEIEQKLEKDKFKSISEENTQKIDENDNNNSTNSIEKSQKVEEDNNESLNTKESTQKVEENDNNSTNSLEISQKIEECNNEASNTDTENIEECTIQLLNDDDESPQKAQEVIYEEPQKDSDIIEECISSKNSKELMIHLKNSSDFEKASTVFDRCFHLSKDFFIELCQEGITNNNAVAHHKYALYLIYQQKKYDESIPHLKESIRQGFTRSYFSLSRLLQSHYHNDKHAFKVAFEGMKKGDKYCQCLFGYFTAKGIGTSKDHSKGVEAMLKSEFNDFYENLPTDIAIYLSKIEGREEESFKWFERAFEKHQTKETINNYGVCFLRGFGTEKNHEKAFEIFKLGEAQNDCISMYHIGFILEGKEPIKSLEYYKKAAQKGFVPAQLKYSFLRKEKDAEESQKFCKLAADQNDSESQFVFGFINEDKDPDVSLEYHKRASNNDNVKSLEILSKRYSLESDSENTHKYMNRLILRGKSKVPIEYAIGLYKSKHYKQAYGYFENISKTNNPIAMYYLAVMHYYGLGCGEDRHKTYEMMAELSKKGIDKATEFLEEKFKK